MDPEQAKKLFQQGHISAEMYMKIVGKSLDSNPQVERRAAVNTVQRAVPTPAQAELQAQQRDAAARAAYEKRQQDPNYTQPQVQPPSTADKTLPGMAPVDWRNQVPARNEAGDYEQDQYDEEQRRFDPAGKAIRYVADKVAPQVPIDAKLAVGRGILAGKRAGQSAEQYVIDKATEENPGLLGRYANQMADLQQAGVDATGRAIQAVTPRLNGARDPIQMQREFSNDQDKEEYLENLRKQKEQK